MEVNQPSVFLVLRDRASCQIGSLDSDQRKKRLTADVKALGFTLGLYPFTVLSVSVRGLINSSPVITGAPATDAHPRELVDLHVGSIFLGDGL